MSTTDNAILARNLFAYADALRNAPRTGGTEDSPEGVRCVSISDTFASQMANDLIAAADLIRQMSAMSISETASERQAEIPAFYRPGIHYTEAEKEAAKAAMESGDVARFQTLVLSKLSTEFGNASEAAHE